LPEKEPIYRLNPGDDVEIRFFFNPELNELVMIRPDGRVSLQLAGEVVLAGKTVAEASAELEELYRKEIRTPRVSIQVRKFGAQKVFVTGEVLRPGPIALPGSVTVLQAISEAGGIKGTGDPKTIILIRKGPDGLPSGRKLNLSAKGMPAPEAGTLLAPFDVVVVPESGIARVDRWVDQHIRQLIPFNLSAGFTYLFQNVPGGAIIPII
jgi:polysaccharide export outer membrane protein